MHEFLIIASKLLQKYKLLLKKQLTKEESQKILTSLRLHRSFPKDEVSLYNLIVNVVNYLKLDTAKYENIRFSGKLQILQDMQELLAIYRLKEGQLINVSQTASCAMVQAIQLMVLPTIKCTPAVAQQLKNCALKIAQYGIQEQQKSFGRALKKQMEKDDDFFSPIAKHYQECLEKYKEHEIAAAVLECEY